MTSPTDPFTDWDGAYVLGALSPDERRDYEQHLAACGACRRAVGELAGVPGLLGLVPVADALAFEDAAASGSMEPDDAPSVAVLTRRVRTARTRTRVLMGAAAVALVVGGFAAGTAVSSTLEEDDDVVAAQELELRLAPVNDSGVEASLAMQSADWGTALEWSCSYPADVFVDGVSYELVVVSRTGERSTVATWTGGTTPRTTGLSATTALRSDEIARIELSTPARDTPLAAVTI